MPDTYDYGNAAMGNMMANWQNAMTNMADQAARAAYNTSMLNNEGDKIALEKAKFAWQQKLDESKQTGMWNGQWNNPQEQWFTSEFGQWFGPGGEPGVGAQTLSAQDQAARIAGNWSGMFGQYYAPGTAPEQGTQTQAAQQQAANIAAQQAGLTGWLYSPAGQAMGIGGPGGAAGQPVQTLAGNEQQYTQALRTMQEQRAAQAQGQTQAQAYLDLLSRLRGPADWAKYQQVLGSTPGGMRDLVAAAMGQYIPGGGATTGVQPQAVSLQSMMGDVSGQPYTGQGGGQLNMPNVYQGGQGAYGMGVQQPYQQQTGWQPAGGQAGGQQGGYAMPQQGQTWGSGIGVGQQQPTPEQQQQGLGGGTNMPAPNQVAAQSWKNLAPSQQQLMLGMWEGQGYDKNDVTALMSQALPKYATNSPTAGTWRMGQ